VIAGTYVTHNSDERLQSTDSEAIFDVPARSRPFTGGVEQTYVNSVWMVVPAWFRIDGIWVARTSVVVLPVTA
jgi:hypothetical protein